MITEVQISDTADNIQLVGWWWFCSIKMNLCTSIIPSSSCISFVTSDISVTHMTLSEALLVFSRVLFASKQTQSKLAPCHHHYEPNSSSRDSSTNLMVNKRVSMTRVACYPLIIIKMEVTVDCYWAVTFVKPWSITCQGDVHDGAGSVWVLVTCVLCVYSCQEQGFRELNRVHLHPHPNIQIKIDGISKLVCSLKCKTQGKINNKRLQFLHLFILLWCCWIRSEVSRIRSLYYMTVVGWNKGEGGLRFVLENDQKHS